MGVGYEKLGVGHYFLASHADILLARHAIFPPGEERLRDEPKECLRGRLLFFNMAKRMGQKK